MRYDSVVPGVFVARPNRFIADVLIDGKPERVHVKNTGRCRELLVPGATVFLSESANPGRATRMDLVAVLKGERLINMDSLAPNKAFGEFLRAGGLIKGINRIMPESWYRASRFDFCVEAGRRRIFIEVKGVTLEEDGAAMFPGAPTARGVRHVSELAACLKNGFEACMAFIIQMEGVSYFKPNNRTHPEFGKALAAARKGGVSVVAFDCRVAPDSMSVGKPVEVRLE